MNLPEDFTFSQSALQDFVECAYRFQLRHLLDVRWPAQKTAQALQYEAGQGKGQDFHHLVHQHTLGVPAELLAATITDEELKLWWANYLAWQAANLPEERFPELTMTAPLADSLLTAKYDVVARMNDGAFLIVDWKTGRPQKRLRLADRMQTLVYPFVLARCGDWLNDGQPIAPERIRLLYWFAETGDVIEFNLSADKLQQDEARLTSLLQTVAGASEFSKTDNER
ncbi:MAG TPA: PD-(D/E)XK nuclease family protein, partial [Blastocatellia bacterium]|nr:PD-(D/E)XK nuclease family protein [Blastocatellia bacterium]